MKKKFKIKTIGCRSNQYESQAFKDQLKGLGFLEGDENVDICIVNSCSVTANAEKNTINSLKSIQNKNPNAKIYLTGCLPIDVINKLDSNIIYVKNSKKKNLISEMFPARVVPSFKIKDFSDHTRAFVKIQDGCDSFCTYCIIPYTRGRSTSRDYKDILKEITNLSDNGYKEIILTGINLGEFKSITLSNLISEIEQIEGIDRIRLSSIDPIHITEDLIKVFTTSKKLMPSLHLVLQSGSNKILKKMNRKYDAKLYLEKVKILKEKIKNFTFTTDIIIGFPNETIEDFDETMKMVKEVEYIKAHIFPYSKRPNTAASKFTNPIDEETVANRKDHLVKIASKVAFEKRNQFINEIHRVLIESKKGKYFFGHTENNILVAIEENPALQKNIVVDVRILKNTDNYLLGEFCK